MKEDQVPLPLQKRTQGILIRYVDVTNQYSCLITSTQDPIQFEVSTMQNDWSFIYDNKHYWLFPVSKVDIISYKL